MNITNLHNRTALVLLLTQIRDVVGRGSPLIAKAEGTINDLTAVGPPAQLATSALLEMLVELRESLRNSPLHDSAFGDLCRRLNIMIAWVRSILNIECTSTLATKGPKASIASDKQAKDLPGPESVESGRVYCQYCLTQYDLEPGTECPHCSAVEGKRKILVINAEYKVAVKSLNVPSTLVTKGPKANIASDNAGPVAATASAEQKQRISRNFASATERQRLWAVVLNLRPYLDGTRWCVCWGKDIQSGITAFGRTPIEAIYAFETEMQDYSPYSGSAALNEGIKELFLDIQYWMMDHDLEETPEGKALFDRISKTTGVNWDQKLMQ